MDFEFLVGMANEILVLLTGLIGLIGTGIGTYFAIKNWVLALNTKNSQETWKLIMEIADKAMEEAERSGAAGVEKKEMVIAAVNAGAKAAGLDTSLFLDQLDDYIEQTIKFVNKMKDANK